MGTIYLIINKQNGLKYVGQTIQGMNKEWKEHIDNARRMFSDPLHRAIRKYGTHNFLMREIEQCKEELLDEREEYWIQEYDTFNNGYNNLEYQEIEEIEEIKKAKELSKPKPSNWGVFTEKNRGNGKHCGIKIQGLNVDTGEIRVWDNARDAAYELTGERNRNSNILDASKKGYIAYGYRWKRLEDKTKKKAVKAIHKVTWQEYEFESCADAIRRVGNGGGGSGLKKALRSNGRYTWKGFIWRYI